MLDDTASTSPLDSFPDDVRADAELRAALVMENANNPWKVVAELERQTELALALLAAESTMKRRAAALTTNTPEKSRTVIAPAQFDPSVVALTDIAPAQLEPYVVTDAQTEYGSQLPAASVGDLSERVSGMAEIVERANKRAIDLRLRMPQGGYSETEFRRRAEEAGHPMKAKKGRGSRVTTSLSVIETVLRDAAKRLPVQ